jgi:hypothetical protein
MINLFVSDMSNLLLTSNRSYLKYPIYTLYRHLSTIEHRNYDQLIFTTTHRNFGCNSISKNESTCCFRNNYYQKRYITLHVPSTNEKQPPSDKSKRLPFNFPPGNPKDKPKLEHLRFIENQLIHIVNDSRILFVILFCLF